MPLPAGKGFIGMFENDIQKFVKETSIVKNYITSCFLNPYMQGRNICLLFILASALQFHPPVTLDIQPNRKAPTRWLFLEGRIVPTIH